MNPEASLIKLRDFSNKLALACFLLPLVACGTSAHPRRIPQTETSPNPQSEHSSAAKRERVMPPWQLWDDGPGLDSKLETAARREGEGKLDVAIKMYRELEVNEPPGRIREEAFVRRVGVLLKLGQSKTALAQITDHLKASSLTQEQISPMLALLAAFAYRHQGDTDQTLAWLGVAYKRSQAQGIVARRATTEAGRVVRELSLQAFPKEVTVWSSDNFVGPIFSAERSRRSQGYGPERADEPNWFRPDTYGAVLGTEAFREADIGPSDAALATHADGTKLGILLPETAKYAEHASRIRQGIELALKESPLSERIKLVYADTAGDGATAEREYERLVNEEKVIMVLGPLLVKTSEQVAGKSNTLGIPFLSFTKRPGLTQLSKVAFRLGATADNQANELAAYARSELNAKSYAVFYPQDGGSGEEFRAAFHRALAAVEGKVVVEAAYKPGDADSVQQAMKALEGKKVQAVFVPDTLENAAPVLTAAQALLGKSVTFLGPAFWYDPVALRGYGALLEGAVCVTPFYEASALPIVTEFVQKYRDAYQKDPDLLAAQGYDAARLVLKSLETAVSSGETRVKEDLIAGLHSVDSFEGVTGKLTVQGSGEIVRRMSVLRLHLGSAVEVMAGGTVTGFLPNDSNQKEGNSTGEEKGR